VNKSCSAKLRSIARIRPNPLQLLNLQLDLNQMHSESGSVSVHFNPKATLFARLSENKTFPSLALHHRLEGLSPISHKLTHFISQHHTSE
jgi:hypothetical protein